MRTGFIEKLSEWFQKNARDLPWRSTPDPYSVWLSEIMLQQTQVATVIPYFNRFLHRFPKVQDLAMADLDEVYRFWAGLGYYSRARNLHQGALAIAKRIEDGLGFPESREELLKIPGIGEYTAGAVSSIAFNRREPIVDGNVERVLSRVNAWTARDPKKTAVWAEAKKLVEDVNSTPRILNQAMMELGALICRPKNPKCGACPVSSVCQGKSHPELYPEPKAKTDWKKVNEERFILLQGRGESLSVYLEKNPAGAWRENLWDFPSVLQGKIQGTGRVIGKFSMKHVVTHHKIQRLHHVFSFPIEREPRVLEKGAWFLLSSLPAVPSPVKKAIAELQKRNDLQ